MGKGHALWARFTLVALSVLLGLTGVLLANPAEMRSNAQDGLQVVVFRQGENGYTGCADTRISEENPHANFGDQWLVLGMKGRAAILMRFDVSSIPAHAFIQEATLSLHVSNFGQRREEPIIAATFPVTRTWEEMQATWYKATDLDDWGLPGCNDTSSDRSPTPTDSQAIHEIGWYHWDVTSALQRWVQDPASNKGLLIKQTNTAVGGEYDMRSSEFAGLEMRPYLTVKYSLFPPTPTQPVTPVPLPCVGTPEPGAVLAILQRDADYDGVEDTCFNFDDRETSYAGDWFMRVGYRRHYSGLIKYDVSAIPQGSRIVCAALSLFAERWSGAPLDVGAYYVQRENSVHEATWTWATSLTRWQQGGCNGPDDRWQTPESVVRIQSVLTWYHLDLTSVVDGWVNGWLPNNGISLQALSEQDRDTVWFTASDDGTVANRPKLVILYVPPSSSVPTRTPSPSPTPGPTATLAPGDVRTDTLQNGLQGYAGCSDVRISAEAPGANFAASDLKVGAKQKLASLIYFDLSSIPRNASIKSALLSVYGYSREGSTNFDLHVYAVKRHWVEAEANWNMATAADYWGVPGCNSVFSDRADAPSDSALVGTAGWYTWAVRDDVQRMVAQPGENEGWLLRQGAEMPGVLAIRSSEYEDSAYRPKLVVTYSVP